MRAIHTRLNSPIEIDYLENVEPHVNDGLVRDLPPGSLVINATGMGKDTPGSPITDGAEFPDSGFAWELNYRGDLQFLHQALKQKESRRLQVYDGWRYFIHGWACVIEEVFDLRINEDRLARLAALSEGERPAGS